MKTVMNISNGVFFCRFPPSWILFELQTALRFLPGISLFKEQASHMAVKSPLGLCLLTAALQLAEKTRNIGLHISSKCETPVLSGNRPLISFT